ncbi:putative Ig domain-containing protein [Shewanella sp. AS16]|uniref:PKD domain-containing protein n=1 Tax=Shewanella sp. AS16 TaxID=2907625 RepID=UPI001F3D6D09|nr:choice-of-anchor U domain-containing protein [Shewanella sp. AS16]MCE9684918.1 putative Ig domain-containing protein [Shewanella sp. AS16]
MSKQLKINKLAGLITAAVLGTLSSSAALASIHLDTTMGEAASVKIVSLDGGAGAFDSTFDAPDRVAVDAMGRVLMVGNISPGVELNNEIYIERRSGDNSLDTSFGSGGKVKISDANYPLYGSVVTLDNQGRILVAGYVGTNSQGNSLNEMRLYRLLADGSIDTSFGEGGETRFTVNNKAPQLTSILSDAQGRVYVGGRVFQSETGNDAFVARFGADGYLDTSFNTSGYQTMGAVGDDWINALAFAGDGVLLASGHLDYKPTLFRFNEDGTLDANFGGSGQLDVSRTTQSSQAYDLGVDASGKILLTTSDRVSDSDTTEIFNLYRYNADGTLDTSFADNGWFGLDVNGQGTGGSNTSTQIKIDSQGRILLGGKIYTGNSTSHMAVLRLSNSGVLDTSFGTNGIGSYYLEQGDANNYPVLIHEDATGNLDIFSHQSGAEGDDLGWARVDGDGHATRPFAKDGTAMEGTADLTLPFDDYEYYYQVRVDAEGRTLVAGNATDSSKTTGDDIILRRYNADGSLDTSFASNGTYQLNVGSGDYPKDLQIDANGNIWLLGSEVYSATGFYLMKLNSSGQPDTSFGTGGLLNMPDTVKPLALILHADGSMFVAGDKYNLARLNADGTLDTAFGNNGIFAATGLGSNDHSWGAGEDSQGRILLAGSVNYQSNSMAMRVNADGTLDTTYGTNGVTTYVLPADNYGAFQKAMVEGDNLWLVVTGHSTNTEYFNYLVHIDATGAVDSSFNGGNPLQFGAGKKYTVSNMQKDSAGRFLFAGYEGTSHYDLAYVQRLNADGSPDETFAPGGLQTFDLDGGVDLESLAVKSNGELVAAGYYSLNNDRAILVHLTENSPPTISGAPASAVNQGAAYSFIPTAADPENDNLSFSIQNKPAWASFDTSTGALTGTPGYADVGNFSGIVISVSDGKLSASLAAFDLSVANVNDAPTGEVTIAASTPNGQTLIASNTLADLDGMGAVSYTWLRAGQAIATGSEYSLVLADKDQDISVRADYTDGYGTAESVSSSVTTATADFFNADADGDNLSNAEELALGTDYTKADSDADGVNDDIDAFPLDINESVDTDQDGTGNNADLDDDNDGVLDVNDAFPLDAAESVDTDNDGIGNNADTDDDNDGIPDVDDSAPLDPKVGDSQAPVFGELLPLTFEATGPTTSVALPQPQVTDNSATAPTLVSDLQGALALGEHIVTWTATDLAGNATKAQQKVTVVDTTAPVFAELVPVNINATGRLTDLLSVVQVAATDLVDGDIAAVLNGDNRYVSGLHSVEFKASDSAGNAATTQLEVAILPALSVASKLVVEVGGEYALPVSLSGQAPAYPVAIGYTVRLNGNQIGQGSTSIAAGTQGQLILIVPDNVLASDTLTVGLERVSNAFVSESSQAQLIVVEQNLTPTLDVSVMQQTQTGNLIDPLKGKVVISAVVKDANLNDSHEVSWSVANNAFEGTVGSASGSDATHKSSFEFDPSGLAKGVYTVDVTVTETSTAERLSSSRRLQLLVGQLAALSAATDTDQDGIVDSQEGYGDTDGDGIADYLDNDSNTTRLPAGSDSEPLQTSTGISMSLGTLVQALNGSTGANASLTAADLATVLAGDAAAADTHDSHFTAATPLVDFTLSGLAQTGDSVAVVIPLASGVTLPEGAVYRKYNTTQGWFSFVEDSSNSVSSASADAGGQCPAPNAAAYVAGLTAGDNCVQLLIQDGGPNDADFIANGAIADPGAIVVEKPNQAPVISMSLAYNVDEGMAVSLDAAATTDAEGDALSFSWQQISGIPVTLSAANQPSLSFVAPEVSMDETLTFELSVDDGVNNSKATVTVVVQQVNQAPTVSIDGHEASYEEGELVTLKALAADVDGNALSYQWTQVSGPTLEFDAGAAEVSLLLPYVTHEETVVMQVTVTDGELSTGTSTSFIIRNDNHGGAMGWLSLLLLAGLARARRALGVR